MISKDEDVSPPERDRTANRRWMIGIVLSLVFGIFWRSHGAAELHGPREAVWTACRSIDRKPSAPPAAPPPAASPTPGPGGGPAPNKDHKGEGDREK